MEPGRGPSHLRNAARDDRSHLIRTLERLHPKEASPQLEGRVRVRPDRAGDPVSTGKFPRLDVEASQHATGVEHLDGVHEWQDVHQIGLVPAPRAEPVERMRHADERPLSPQPTDRLLRRKPRGNLLGHVRGQDFAARRHDLLPHNDPLRVQSLRRPRPRDGVVVCDDDAVNPLTARRRNQVRGTEEGILGGEGVGVEFEGELR